LFEHRPFSAERQFIGTAYSYLEPQLIRLTALAVSQSLAQFLQRDADRLVNLRKIQLFLQLRVGESSEVHGGDDGFFLG
jgi:hypothetical protein